MVLGANDLCCNTVTKGISEATVEEHFKEFKSFQDFLKTAIHCKPHAIQNTMQVH